MLARVAGATVASIDDALFERRSLLRTLAMRRTLFVAPTAFGAVVENSSSVLVALTERKRLEKFLAESNMAEPSRWLADLFQDVLAALDGATDGLAARELTKLVPDLATRITMGAGTKHAVEAGATSRVLGLMAVEGLIVRGRPTGDWTSRMYRWHRRDRWWPDGSGPGLLEPEREEQASVALLRHWLARFGPASPADMRWWTGWTMTKTRRVLAAIDTVEVLVEGSQVDDEEIGHLLVEDGEPVLDDEPWAALLPALDPTAMGWKQRAWYLGDHRAELFDRNGNIGPTIWVDGRIVGGWSQNPDGRVVTELLEPVGADHRAMIDVEVERVAAFVGSVVVKPSFPTPLQRRLSAG